jgi:hypothetical protein
LHVFMASWISKHQEIWFLPVTWRLFMKIYRMFIRKNSSFFVQIEKLIVIRLPWHRHPHSSKISLKLTSLSWKTRVFPEKLKVFRGLHWRHHIFIASWTSNHQEIWFFLWNRDILWKTRGCSFEKINFSLSKLKNW